MELWHINFATLDRMPLFASGEAARLEALRRLALLRGLALLLFCIVDDHFHAVLKGTRAHAGLVVRRIKRAWASLIESKLSEGFYRRVESRQHLRSLVRYHLQQPKIHGLDEHPALWSGSCFSDLVGTRRLPGLEPGLGQVLPRLDRAQLFCDAGLPTAIEPASDALLRAAGPEQLVAAAAFALAIHPTMFGQDSPAMEARAAATQLASAAGLARGDMAELFGCSSRTLRRLARRPLSPGVEQAIRLRLTLQQMIGPKEV